MKNNEINILYIYHDFRYIVDISTSKDTYLLSALFPKEAREVFDFFLPYFKTEK